MKFVDVDRISLLNSSKSFGPGAIVYWMSRENRLDDNWSFLYALELAIGLGQGVTVVVTLPIESGMLTIRTVDFLIAGLKEVEKRARSLSIPFVVLSGGNPDELVKNFAEINMSGAVVCDFDPLRLPLLWRENLSYNLTIPVFEVDSHNVVPCRRISTKQEYSAYTLRRKIEPLLSRYLVPYPELDNIFKSTSLPENSCLPQACSWEGLMESIRIDNSISIVKGLTPGFSGGMGLLYDFIEEKLKSYNDARNDPNLNGQSGLSPYLHFGHISSQTAALAAARFLGDASLKGGFLDEIIVRRELSDNYCFYNSGYDDFSGFPDWAKTSLNIHSNDRRDYLYELEEFEQAATHDLLWNAAQHELVNTGKMHGYMRMYWAKKVLEWSLNADKAMKIAVYLNDKYSIDGKDPNGYAGCAWSIGGLHDRAWSERPVFGKIRYMNEKGCRRKFDVDLYISKHGEMSTDS